MILDLPYPPSVNHIYGKKKGGGVYLLKRVAVYRRAVCAAVAAARAAGDVPVEPMACRVLVRVVAHVPDRRKRDINNLWKAMEDAWVCAGLIEDDSLIDDSRIRRGAVIKGGVVTAEIVPCVEPPPQWKGKRNG